MQLETRRSKLNSPQLLFASLSPDATFFVAGTVSGYRVFSTNPINLIISREYNAHKDSDFILDKPGGISYFQIRQGSNIFALVAGGKRPKFDPNVLVLYDDIQGKVLFKMEFSAQVRATKMHGNWY